MTTDDTISVLRDLLRVYDQRFLCLDGGQREGLLEGTRKVIGAEGLSDDARAVLPSSVRLRAFCIQHGLRDELERLIRDEADGSPAGAVVVGGRIYAMYPYLRGVSRQDADITAEVGVDHRLDAAGWQSKKIRIRGTAVLQRVETHRTAVDLVLRERTSGKEHRIAAEPHDGGFDAVADPAALDPGRWDVHVAATSLGITREARLGTVRGPGVKTGLQRRTTAPDRDTVIYFTRGGHLALQVIADPGRPPLLTRLRRHLTR